MSRILLITFGLCFTFLGCKQDPVVEPKPGAKSPTPVEMEIPPFFPRIKLPDNNPLTVEGIALGRRLYYDELLSKNGPLQGSSCATCHDQKKSFGSNASGTSVIPHVNMAWRTNFLWTGKLEGSLEDAMIFEVRDFFQSDLSELRKTTIYPTLFEDAFGSNEITLENTAFALAQFFRSLTSSNSRYDLYTREQTQFTGQEREGLRIFLSEKGDCFHCHTLPLTRDNSFHNIGLDSVFEGANQGRFLVTGDSNDIGKFMTPSLRNIALTGPYMHDGRFSTLEEVIEHYNTGVKRSDYLDPVMTKIGKERGLRLNPQDKADLLAFLRALTDTSFLNDPSLGSPF
jgi:cytochrome c peroxidase